jgi:plasmid stabilization system protein ParE
VRVFLTESAKLDLLRIGDFIAEDNATRAKTFVRELREAVAQLSKMPEAFPLVPRYEKHGVRRRIHGNYLIFYRIEPSQIIVIRILHGARDFEPILFPAS